MLSPPLPSLGFPVLRRLLNNLQALLVWGLVPAALLGLYFAPVSAIMLMPWVTFALAALLLGWVMLFPNPTKLGSLPRFLMAVTVLRLVADLSASGLMLTSGFPEHGWLCWSHHDCAVATLVALGLQLAVIVLGQGQAGRLFTAHSYFVLDILPGRQMGLDADYHAGVIDADEARRVRQEIEQVHDFFDFLKSAARFASLDAWISVVILSVSSWEIWQLLGQPGLLQIVLVHNFLTAVSALLMHATLELCRLKAVKVEHMAETLRRGRSQVGRVGLTWVLLGLTFTLLLWAGVPMVGSAMIALTAVGLIAARGGSRERAQEPSGEIETRTSVWLESHGTRDPVTVELGHSLLGLVDPRKDRHLLHKMTEIRESLRQELGFIVPGVRFCCNLALDRQQYRILIDTKLVSTGEVRLGSLMALGPAELLSGMGGERVEEPAYGLPAVWLDPAQVNWAETHGCLLFDPMAVIASDLSHRLRSKAAELLTFEEVAARAEALNLADFSHRDLRLLHATLALLLAEEVPIHDLEAVLCPLIMSYPSCNSEARWLASAMREALSRSICHALVDGVGTLRGVSLVGAWEAKVASLSTLSAGGRRLNTPLTAEGESIIEALALAVRQCKDNGRRPIFITSTVHRWAVAWIVRSLWPEAVVLARAELHPSYRLQLSYL